MRTGELSHSGKSTIFQYASRCAYIYPQIICGSLLFKVEHSGGNVGWMLYIAVASPHISIELRSSYQVMIEPSSLTLTYVKVRLLPTLKGLDPDESVDSSNLHRANESVDSSYLRESNRSESIGSDHIRSVKVGIQRVQEVNKRNEEALG